MKMQETDTSLKQDLMDSDRCSIKQMGSPSRKDPDTYLQETKGGVYTEGEDYRRVDDIYAANFSSCYLATLEKMQCRAYINVPIFQGDKLWGLFCVYQNDRPRDWEGAELESLQQVGVQLGNALRQIQYLDRVKEQSDQLTKIAERETNFIRLIYKIGQRIIERLQQKTLNPETLFRSITQEMRQLLKTDRVAVYRFNEDWSGQFIIEDVGSGFLRLAGTDASHVEDATLQETRGGIYRNKETSAVNDIEQAAELTFDRDQLQQWGVKAYAIAPLFKGEQRAGTGNYSTTGKVRRSRSRWFTLVKITGISRTSRYRIFYRRINLTNRRYRSRRGFY